MVIIALAWIGFEYTTAEIKLGIEEVLLERSREDVAMHRRDFLKVAGRLLRADGGRTQGRRGRIEVRRIMGFISRPPSLNSPIWLCHRLQMRGHPQKTA